MRGTAVILLTTAFMLSGCASSRPTTERSTYIVTLHPYVGKLRYVEATSPPGARLLFDTAGGLTLLSPAIAQSAHCIPYKRLTAFRMAGTRFDVDGCGPAQVAFGSLAVQPESAVFDLMSILPAGLPQLDGLISLQTFLGSVVTIDLARERLEIADAPDNQAVASMSSLPVRLSGSFAGSGVDVFVRIHGSRGPLWFELDSGNLDSVLISNRLLDQFDFSPAQVQSLQQGTPTRVLLQLDGLGKVIVSARGADIIYDGVLNADLLERMTVVLDLGHGLAWAKLHSK
jgi:hypothetical protein